MLRTVLKYSARGGLVILALPLAYIVLAFILSVIPVNQDAEQPATGIDVFIRSNGVHAEFVLPIATEAVNWRAHFPTSHFRNVGPPMTHIAFGWGDRGFYLETPTWADLRFDTAFKALFLKSSSAMHVTYLSNPAAGEQYAHLLLSPAQYQLLVEYVWASFQKDASNTVIVIPNTGYGTNDAFYEATRSYSLWNTCNAWTGEGLRHIGVKTGVWTPFAESVFFHL